MRITETEMDILLAEMRKTNPDDAKFVLEWYQRDTNAIPPEYILKVGEGLDSKLRSGAYV